MKKLIIAILVLIIISCNEEKRKPEYPPEEVVADTAINKYTIDFVKEGDSVSLRIVNLEDNSLVKVVQSSSIKDTSDMLVKMWNCTLK